ncbi:hypothetical protein BDV93DRAFT_520383 [Ceratobasidium sp. AG-I]|nr:hypothetical protein BDV93DRAFT_520383 [Ceratobasidium sp. AG-I]
MGQDGNTPIASAMMRRPATRTEHSSSRVIDKEQSSVSKNASTAPNGIPPDSRSQPHAQTRPPSRSANVDNSEHPKKPARSAPSPEEIEKMKLEEDIRHLKEKLQYYSGESYRQEVTSIRTHLQVNDLQEPWQISQKFEEITKQVENISRNLGESFSQYKPTRSPRTVDLVRITRQCMSRPDPPAAETPVDMDPEDFIDFGCRTLVNDFLMKTFDQKVFHPALEPEQNEMLVDMYNRIREKEPQVIAGRWRVSSFNSYESDSYSPKEQAAKFCRGRLFRFCTALYLQEACTEAINSIISDVEKLFELAWSWNVSTKTSVVMLDFHPYQIPPGEAYYPEGASLEGGRKAKPPASGAILVTTRLGLMSSEAIGGSASPRYSSQLKANVLAAEYFT